MLIIQKYTLNFKQIYSFKLPNWVQIVYVIKPKKISQGVFSKPLKSLEATKTDCTVAFLGS